MRSLRSVLFALMLGSAAGAWAIPAYLQTFLATYPGKARLKAASCALCHTEVPAHNAYGKAVLAAMGPSMAIEVDARLLRSLEVSDSDGDGVSNGDEIRSDTLPGDPKSVPVVKPAAPSTSPPVTTPAAAPSLLPRHAFHPSLVHFPLALFLFGGVLDLVGLARGRSAVRQAGIWNMTAGAVATALAIPTGFVAASLSGYALTWGSAVMTHLLFAGGGTLLMTAMVAWRARAERNGVGYVLLLLLTIALVGWAGHLGGNLVYGS